MEQHQYVGRPLGRWELDGFYPSVSVIVLNYREPEITSECLRSIISLRYGGKIEVIVLDNGSGDGSFERLRVEAGKSPLPVRVLATDQNLGFTGGVLTAWPHATGELICLLNNDATFHPDCLARLVDGFRRRADLGAVWPFDAPHTWSEGLQVPDPAKVALMRNGTHSVVGGNIWLPLMSDYKECFTPSGVCLLLQRSTDVPFPGEYFAYYEDVYFGWRLRLRGLKAERVLEAIIYHEGSRTGRLDLGLRQALGFHAEKNRLANLILFYAGSTLLRILPLLLLDEAKKLVMVIASITPGRSGAAKLARHIQARLWLLRHAAWIRSRRKQVQAERRVTDHEILQLMSGRLTMLENTGGRFVNFLSLSYCRLARLQTVEFRRTAAARE